MSFFLDAAFLEAGTNATQPKTTQRLKKKDSEQNVATSSTQSPPSKAAPLHITIPSDAGSETLRALAAKRHEKQSPTSKMLLHGGMRTTPTLPKVGGSVRGVDMQIGLGEATAKRAGLKAGDKVPGSLSFHL